MARNTKVSICALGLCKTPGCTPPAFDLKRNVERAIELLRLAATEGSDLAVLPEAFAVQDARDWIDRAEPLDGYVISRLTEEAGRLGISIAAGHPTRENGYIYNSIVLIGRDGRLAAVYHKTYPTINELEHGVTPGLGPVVVDTEFGRLGFGVCYDLNYAELRLGYRDMRPDMIIFCSAFRGGLQACWWGYETRSFITASCIDGMSVIVNPLGRVVAQTDEWSRSVTKAINLDCGVLHYDYTNRSLDEARRKYGKLFEFEWSEPEGVMLVTALGDMSVRSLAEAMRWEQAEDYFARARKLRDQALEGTPIQEGPEPW